jgi:tetratricopeptide (TPR) repeat protein
LSSPSFAESRNVAQQSKLAVDLATAAIRAGDLVEAQRLLHERLARAPSDSNAVAKLAEIAIGLGKVEQGTILLRRAVALDPTTERRLALIRHLPIHVGPTATLQQIEEFPPDARKAFPIRAMEAAMFGMLGMTDRQEAIYEELIVENPDDAKLWESYANTLKANGRIDEAVVALRRAIKVAPTYGEAYWTLADFKSFRFADAEIRAMRKALRAKLAGAAAIHFHFALGKALEDRKSFAQSFRHYAQANELRAKELTPEQMSVARYVDAALKFFDPSYFDERKGLGHDARDPIFVVGLHRAGSTLIEQILASQSQIEGTSELYVIPQIWSRLEREAAAAAKGSFDYVAGLPAAELAALGAEYIERTRPFRITGKPLFVDKLPSNWLHLWLIRLILPNARIIDARRHPMACGFSNFKQHYAPGINFAYSLESIGAFYRDYWRFLTHMNRVQSGSIHRVINEQLIDDAEGEVRRLLDFIGVPFEPACLEFHKTRRVIQTPSAEQVRKGLSREGVDQWRNYEPWLGPLKVALGDALDNWDKA